MSTASTTPHLEDHQLLHLVDGDAGNFELDQWSKHALACGECAARLDRLGSRSAAVRDALQELQLPASFRLPAVPEVQARGVARRRWETTTGSPWLRAAAIVTLILMPLVAIEPLRAWVFDQVSSAWTALGFPAGEEPAASGDAGAAGTSTILFGAGATELTITVASPQIGGELVITPGGDPEGALRIVDGETETPLVTAAGLRIDNTIGSEASYSVRLPSTVRSLIVRVGDETVQTHSGPLDRTITIDLSR